jgi:alcohol dehydrogenase, propanol-preferring
MKAMILSAPSLRGMNRYSLEFTERAVPEPAPDGILIKVSACGVCHTELDEIEGRTPPPVLPVIPGHQVVGTVVGTGSGAVRFKPGDRAGVGWIGSACGRCRFCAEGFENLCPEFRAVGRDLDGGYAEFMTVRENFAYPVPETLTDAEAAPLLCAGAIGYRSIRLAKITDGCNLGLTGFGASAHLVLKTVRYLYPKTRIFVFARRPEERSFASELGAVWTGGSADPPPEKLRAVIDTTPVWEPAVESLKNLEPRGRLVVNAIRKEDADKTALLKLDYAEDLWMEKEIKSVANVTRNDVAEFLELAGKIPIKPEVKEYPLEKANEALLDLKDGGIRGAKVLRIS